MQEPLHGVSMASSFEDANAAERHETQYFEMVCNRGIYHKGLSAVTRHGNPPWVVVGAQPSLADDVWELYNTTKDWSQAHDLAKQMPEKVAELKRLFDLEASNYNVFPLDDRKAERTNPDISGRPQVVRGNTQLFFPGMRRMSENSVINIKNKSHAVTADIDVPDGGAAGVIAAHGGNFGGWSLYAHGGRLRYHYNFLGLKQFDVTSTEKLPAGPHQVRVEFTYDGGGLGKGGTATLYGDGKLAGGGRVERTHAFFFSMDETMEIGCDVGEPVSPDYGPRGNAFTGTIKWVQIDIDALPRTSIISHPHGRRQIQHAGQRAHAGEILLSGPRQGRGPSQRLEALSGDLREGPDAASPWILVADVVQPVPLLRSQRDQSLLGWHKEQELEVQSGRVVDDLHAGRSSAGGSTRELAAGAERRRLLPVHARLLATDRGH